MSNKQIFRDGPFEYEIEEIPAGVDPREFLQRAIDNCPECQALIAQGEKPEIISGDELMRAVVKGPRGLERFRRPRWRTRKRL